MSMTGGARRQTNTVKRLTLDALPGPIYGCTGLFDLCGTADLMSLSFQGMSPFSDWLGWEATDICILKQYFVTWARPAYSGGNPTAGHLADPCADPNGAEWGMCDFTIEDFARLRRGTPARDFTKSGLRLCDAQPRYRLDGTRITNDLEYDMRITTEVVIQDLLRMLVNGNAETDGMFSGLETLVKTGYTNAAGRSCSAMDSIVIDWNNNDTDGTGGGAITWNGVVQTGYDLIDVLMAVVRQIRQRIKWSPSLASQNLQVGDIAIVAPTPLIACILDAYTCWSVCPGVEFKEANLNTFDARSFRDRLNGGMFDAGRIWVDGLEIPLIAYDWGLIKGPTHFDAYVLTRGVGSERLLRGQYNDMARAVRDGGFGGDDGGLDFMATDGGRLLTWKVRDHTCLKQIVEMQPRLVMNGPWAQARIQDIVCKQPGPVFSPDPTETSFYPETSFFVAGS